MSEETHDAAIKLVIDAKRRHRSRLLRYPNVTGIGVAEQETEGARTGTFCLRVYVSRKIALAELAPRDVLPREINGVAVDVVEDEFSIHKATSKERHTTLLGGISVGNPALGGAGTLGSTAYDRGSGQQLLLSNWHVICGRDNCLAGEPIIQPGEFDGGRPGDVVARLHRWALTDEVDAAVALITGHRFLGDRLLNLGRLRGIGTAALGQTTRKSGRTTGVTAGTIDDIDADLSVGDYPDGTRTFHHQIVIIGPGVSAKGDSGSVWMDIQNQAIGLNFAGSANRAIANPIHTVLDALHIDLGPGPALHENLGAVINT